MSRSINEAQWQQLTENLTQELGAWRTQHPTATLRELEVALDARLNHMRARMLEDLASTSTAVAWTTATVAEHPNCPQCHERLQSDGHKTRQLDTHGGERLTLERSYGVCPACGAGFFPPR